MQRYCVPIIIVPACSLTRWRRHGDCLPGAYLPISFNHHFFDNDPWYAEEVSRVAADGRFAGLILYETTTSYVPALTAPVHFTLRSRKRFAYSWGDSPDDPLNLSTNYSRARCQIRAYLAGSNPRHFWFCQLTMKGTSEEQLPATPHFGFDNYPMASILPWRR